MEAHFHFYKKFIWSVWNIRTDVLLPLYVTFWYLVCTNKMYKTVSLLEMPSFNNQSYNSISIDTLILGLLVELHMHVTSTTSERDKQ